MLPWNCIERLRDHFGDYVIVVTCRSCRHAREMTPAFLARHCRSGWDEPVANIIARFRCRCGKKLADVQIGVSGARNLVRRAAWLTDSEPGEHPEVIPAAFAYAAGVATHGTTTSAHMQGGLGFPIEADASLYFLRAKGWSVLAGDPSRDAMAVGDALIARATTLRTAQGTALATA